MISDLPIPRFPVYFRRYRRVMKNTTDTHNETNINAPTLTPATNATGGPCRDSVEEDVATAPAAEVADKDKEVDEEESDAP